MRGANVLITGGAGTIGSALAKRLAQENNVYVLDDLSSGRRGNIPRGVEFLHCDISQGVPGGLPQMEHIFHCAALFANQNSVDHPVRDLEVNGLGLLHLLEFARGMKRLKSFVYTSSSCVYGGEAATPMKEDFIPLYLGTPYAISKLIGEYYCKYYCHYWGLPTISVRLFNVYGPGEYPGKYRNVIPNFIDKALCGDVLTITGTGEETRDFTYIEDVVDVLEVLAQSPAAIGQVINVGTGRETSIKRLAELIVELIPEAGGLDFQNKRDWDNVSRRCADVTKLKEIAGFLPATDISTGLAKTVAWHRCIKAEKVNDRND